MKKIIFCLLLLSLLLQTKNLHIRNEQDHQQSTLGRYCDEWDKCPSGYYCANRKCALSNCSSTDQCGSGFSCEDGRCISNQHAQDGRYCDEWTKCSSEAQCYNKKCVPLNCWSKKNCAYGFDCQNQKCVIANETQVQQNSEDVSQQEQAEIEETQSQEETLNQEKTKNQEETKKQEEKKNRSQSQCNGILDCPIGQNCKDQKCVPLIDINIGL